MQLTCCLETMLQISSYYNLRHPILPTPLPAQLLNIITPKARLDISQLPQSVQQYYTNNAAKKHMEYLLCRPAALSDLFGADTQRQAVPTSISPLILFVPHLANLGLTHCYQSLSFFYSSFTCNPRKTLTVLNRIHTSLTVGAERH